MRCEYITETGNQCKRMVSEPHTTCYQHRSNSHSTSSKPASGESLYDQLGGVFAIAAVVNLFSDNILKNPLVGVDSPNKYLRDWSRKSRDRLPGLKFMRTLWVCAISGGPFNYQGTHPDLEVESTFSRSHLEEFGLHAAHSRFHITGPQFDAVAKELQVALKYYKVPKNLIEQVLTVFNQHRSEVVTA